MLVTTQCILLTNANFQSEVLDAQLPVLVDCWASWCGTFQPINPMLEALAIEFTGHLQVGRLDIGTAETLAARYAIRAVPTLLLFKDGYLIERVVGGLSKEAIASKINNLLLGSDSSRSRIA